MEIYEFYCSWKCGKCSRASRLELLLKYIEASLQCSFESLLNIKTLILAGVELFTMHFARSFSTLAECSHRKMFAYHWDFHNTRRTMCSAKIQVGELSISFIQIFIFLIRNIFELRQEMLCDMWSADMRELTVNIFCFLLDTFSDSRSTPLPSFLYVEFSSGAKSTSAGRVAFLANFPMRFIFNWIFYKPRRSRFSIKMKTWSDASENLFRSSAQLGYFLSRAR